MFDDNTNASPNYLRSVLQLGSAPDKQLSVCYSVSYINSAWPNKGYCSIKYLGAMCYYCSTAAAACAWRVPGVCLAHALARRRRCSGASSWAPCFQVAPGAALLCSLRSALELAAASCRCSSAGPLATPAALSQGPPQAFLAWPAVGPEWDLAPGVAALLEVGFAPHHPHSNPAPCKYEKPNEQA
jgi:hypothetical protein